MFTIQFYQPYAGKPMFINVQCSVGISLPVRDNFYFLKRQHRVRDLSSRASWITFGMYLSFFRHIFINKGYQVSSCFSFLQNLNANTSSAIFQVFHITCIVFQSDIAKDYGKHFKISEFELVSPLFSKLVSVLLEKCS